MGTRYTLQPLVQPAMKTLLNFIAMFIFAVVCLVHHVLRLFRKVKMSYVFLVMAVGLLIARILWVAVKG